MTSVTEPQTTLKKGFVGQSIPRKEDKRLVQGQGIFFDDVRRHGMGYVHFVRSPHAHAKIVSIDVAGALALDGVYGTLTGDEVAIQTDPFFEMSTPPGNEIISLSITSERPSTLATPSPTSRTTPTLVFWTEAVTLAISFSSSWRMLLIGRVPVIGC